MDQVLRGHICRGRDVVRDTFAACLRSQTGAVQPTMVVELALASPRLLIVPDSSSTDPTCLVCLRRQRWLLAQGVSHPPPA